MKEDTLLWPPQASEQQEQQELLQMLPLWQATTILAPTKHKPVIAMFLTNTGLGVLDHTEKAVVLQYRTLLPRFNLTYK